MKQAKFLILLILCCIASACTTSKSVVSKTADLNKYQYASLTDVMNYQGSANLMDAEVIIFDAIEASRLKMVGDQRINDLTDNQKSQLLLVRFGVTQNDDESVVTVNFVDYMTGRPIASCRGAYAFGLDRNGDFKGALKRVAKQIQETFPK